MLFALVSYWILKIAVTFSGFWVSVLLTLMYKVFFINYEWENSSDITIFQQTKLWVTTVIEAYMM